MLFQSDIDRYSVHKLFRRKAQHAGNGGYFIGKCWNIVMGQLVTALWVSFLAPLAASDLLTRERGGYFCKIFLASNTEKQLYSSKSS